MKSIVQSSRKLFYTLYFGQQTSDHGLPTMWITDFGLQTLDFGLWTLNYGLRTMELVLLEYRSGHYISVFLLLLFFSLLLSGNVVGSGDAPMVRVKCFIANASCSIVRELPSSDPVSSSSPNYNFYKVRVSFLN